MPYLLPLPMIAELTGAPQKPSGIRPQRSVEPREALIPKWELAPEVRGSSKNHCTRGSAISPCLLLHSEPPAHPRPRPRQKQTKTPQLLHKFSISEKRKKEEIFQEFLHRFLTDTSLQVLPHLFHEIVPHFGTTFATRKLSRSRCVCVCVCVSLSLSHREKGSS
jgi:hypothetical protein